MSIVRLGAAHCRVATAMARWCHRRLIFSKSAIVCNRAAASRSFVFFSPTVLCPPFTSASDSKWRGLALTDSEKSEKRDGHVRRRRSVEITAQNVLIACAQKPQNSPKHTGGRGTI